MRTIVIFAAIIILSINASAQTLEEIVQKINLPMATSELIATRAQLERLSAAPQADRSAIYYLAYADVELSFRMENDNQKAQYIDEAQKYLDKIKDGDKSEIETLRGYSYFALMAIDPRTNGPKYAPDIIACYEKALKANPDNPRAFLLNAVFRSNMAKAMGGQYKEFEADVIRSRELFAAQDTTSLKPYWGTVLLRRFAGDH
ncbi:MAG: hypothetical protein LBJ39_00775 [Tannerellaceae bacterium]|jgi:tetratricopeptide (TPR) repeat protein|nr:hypothetical protein [Tannerellaceae bacterium]